jgi:F0F1-type ATP synthase membrane subunit b/b'
LGDLTVFGIPISLGTMIYQAFIFTVLTFLLKKYVLGKLVNVIDTRKLHIKKQLQIAEMHKQAAEKNLEESNEALKEARKNAREIMNHSETEADLIIRDAKFEARQILKEAKEEAFFIRSHSLNPSGQTKGA